MKQRQSDKNSTRSFTVRLPKDQADVLETIARAYGRPLNDEFRDAAAVHLRDRLKSSETRQRLQELRERTDRQVDELLADGDTGGDVGLGL